ncbi:MAG: hypothetical protein GY945_00615 [Rhodobacteraceae bacterium]|nr:hypothetical protein [Paracoccaceae bacterium]
MVGDRFRFFTKKKLIQRFDPPKLPPKGKIATYKKLRTNIENGTYLSLIAQFEEMEAKRIERKRKAEEAHIERERKRLNPHSSPPKGKSVSTVSGGLPTLGKRR